MPCKEQKIIWLKFFLIILFNERSIKKKMKKEKLLSALQSEFENIEKRLAASADTAYFKQPQPEKWSEAQVTQHLINSVRGIATSLKDPSVLAQFGEANRPSLDYDNIQYNYKTGLAARQAQGMPYRHLDVPESKEELLDNFRSINQKLLERVALLSEHQLDTLQLPHPLLGLMTMREMLLFTAIHTKHHFELL
jgi:hypothetical protein